MKQNRNSLIILLQDKKEKDYQYIIQKHEIDNYIKYIL